MWGSATSGDWKICFKIWLERMLVTWGKHHKKSYPIYSAISTLFAIRNPHTHLDFIPCGIKSVCGWCGMNLRYPSGLAQNPVAVVSAFLMLQRSFFTSLHMYQILRPSRDHAIPPYVYQMCRISMRYYMNAALTYANPPRIEEIVEFSQNPFYLWVGFTGIRKPSNEYQFYAELD